MIDLQQMIEDSGIRRDSDNRLFFQANGNPVTKSNLDALHQKFLASHPDWTLDDLETINIVGITSLGDGE